MSGHTAEFGGLERRRKGVGERRFRAIKWGKIEEFAGLRLGVFAEGKGLVGFVSLLRVGAVGLAGV